MDPGQEEAILAEEMVLAVEGEEEEEEEIARKESFPISIIQVC